jgi:HD-like signal output (HDOD) protein/CheY-like chemotaxis protein
MTLPTVLFVDDEVQILDGLKRMLHGRRNLWRMLFASGGVEALEILKRERIDVVVSDMRMPGMDGAALLTEVARQWPDTVRIVLSGHSSEATSVRAVGLSHQYLSKPCNRVLLESKVDRALALRRDLNRPEVRTAVLGLKFVPSPVAIYHRLLGEFKAIQTDPERVNAVFSDDPGLSAQVLKIANSSYFGHARTISLPSQAVSYLGMDAIRALVLAHGITSAMHHAEAPPFNAARTIREGAAVGAFARRIAAVENCSQEERDTVTVAGFLHDIGKLVLAENHFDAYAKVLEKFGPNNAGICDAERAAFGITHAELGGVLLGIWGLPDPIVEAVAYHHSSSLLDEDCPNICTIVRVAGELIAAGREADTATLGRILTPAPPDRRSLLLSMRAEFLDTEDAP